MNKGWWSHLGNGKNIEEGLGEKGPSQRPGKAAWSLVRALGSREGFWSREEADDHH